MSTDYHRRMLAGLRMWQGALERDGRYEAGKLTQWAADRIEHVDSEVASVLVQLDELAGIWGDEAKFRRCRDRLRAVTEKGGG